jgi:flagellar hook-associated protein 3 FlgL
MNFNPNINASVTADIQQSQQAVTTAFEQVSTGQRVNQPSDNPAASAAYIELQAQSANVDQYTANASSALSQAQLSDSVVTQVVSLLTQAVTLGTSGANSTNSAADRQSDATSIQGILSNVIGLANTTFQGVSLFGGTVSGKAAFVADASSPTGYTYQGNNNVNQISVGDTLSVQANIPGSTLFENPNASVLGALSNLATALQSGTSADIGTATAAITTALNYVTAQHGVFGNTINQLNSQETYLSQETVTLTSQAQSLVGIDSATAAENLTQAETENSSVLAAAAKVIQNTLLNYLQ